METLFFFAGISLLVFLSVLLLQRRNWSKAFRQSERISEILESNWSEDAERLGNTVTDRFDRLVAPPLDDIRRFSNAALVTGIGGTMLIFFIEAIVFLLARPEIESLPSPEVVGMIISGAIALLSSLLGVVVHLLISLTILGEAQDRVTQAEGGIVEALTKHLPPPPPDPDFVRALERFFERQDTLNSLIQDAMEFMISSVGGAIEKQQTSVENMERNIEELTGELKKLPGEIIESLKVNEAFNEVADSYIVSVRKFTATLNTGDSRGILPHSVMYGAIQMLVRYERFGEILHEDCVFMDAVRGFHAPIRQRASIFVRKNTRKYLQKPLMRSLNGIYWRYSEFSDRHYIEKLSNRMSNLFEAFLKELKDTIIQNQEEVKNWLYNQVHPEMSKIFEDLEKTVDKTIKVPLEDMSDALNNTAHEMPKAKEAAKNFVLQLKASEEILESIAGKLEKFPDSIDETVSRTTSQTLKPLVDQTEKFNEYVQRAHKKSSDTIEGLVNLIKKLIEEIEFVESKK